MKEPVTGAAGFMLIVRDEHKEEVPRKPTGHLPFQKRPLDMLRANVRTVLTAPLTPFIAAMTQVRRGGRVLI